MKDGKTVVSSLPDFSNRVFSEGQLTQQSRFQQASAYARAAAKTQPLYAKLAAQTGSNAYRVALSDWFKPPVIHEVQRLPGRIRVDASDNVLITSVLVTVSDEHGQSLEQGEAVLINDGWWEYAASASTAGKILVQVFDLAGNVASGEA